MNELFLTVFLRDILGVKAPDLGREFNETRAHVAYDLVSDTAKTAATLHGAPNRIGFFPRVSLRDRGDIEFLRELVDERAAELKGALLNAAGAYALGSEVLTLSELREVRDDYLGALRMSLALEEEYKRWHKEQAEVRAAAQRASAAYDPQQSSVETNGN
jgi:hypothetical protein